MRLTETFLLVYTGLNLVSGEELIRNLSAKQYTDSDGFAFVSNRKKSSYTSDDPVSAPDPVSHPDTALQDSDSSDDYSDPHQSTQAGESLGYFNASGNFSHASGDHVASHHLHAPAIFYITLTLVIGAIARLIFKLVHHHVLIPYPVFVLLLGCAYGVIVRQHPALHEFTVISETNPEVILLMFLPILIYEGAFTMQTHLFQKLFVHMLLIGTVGMGISIVAVAYFSVALFKDAADVAKWDIHVGLIFSAIVSATDPVAVILLLKETGSAKTLSIMLEGTSLLSDASSIVLFQFFQRLMQQHEAVSAAYEIGNVLRMVIGGPLWGLFMGMLLTQVLSRVPNIWEAEVVLIISAPYVTFWCADAAFGISGALATVVLGLWMSSHRACMSPEVEKMIHRIWEVLALIADTLIFSLFGVLIIQTAIKRVVKEDWWLWLSISCFIIAIRAFTFCLLKPFLCMIGIGKHVFTWPNVLVMVWGGFRGGMTLALGLLAAESEMLSDRPLVAAKVAIHSAGFVAFTLLINASSMRFVLKRLGVLDLPLAKLISINMALKNLKTSRQEELEIMALDKYMAEADWQMVDELTRLDNIRFGIAENNNHKASLTLHYVSRGSTVTKPGEIRKDPTAEEIVEMENIARLRLINAKKTVYWTQFEEGTLSQRGVEHLDDLSDSVMHRSTGMIGADDIKQYLANERWSGVQLRITKLHRWIDVKRSEILEIPPQHWRQMYYKLARSTSFEYFVYAVIIVDIVDTVVDVSVTSAFSDIDWLPLIFLYTNLTFMIVYTVEAASKIIGLSWRGYWGYSWLSWNRLDFFVLYITYIDLAFSFVAQYSSGVTLSADVIHIFRFIRLVRFGRTFRLLKPLLPRTLKFLDNRINSHLFFSYDVARAFIVGQEEINQIIPTIIGYKPLVAKVRLETEKDTHIITKEIGLLNEQRPDVAAAVKTRQAARCILNHIHKSMMDMRKQGILEESDVEHMLEEIEDRLKKLRHFPHSISVMGSRDRLWNVPWIHGNQEVFATMKTLFVERSSRAGETFMTAGLPVDGIYFITNGVVSIRYQNVAHDDSDNDDLGEVYNSDGLQVAYEVSGRTDFVLAGTMMNEQSVVLDVPRGSHATCETKVSILFLDIVSLFKAIVAQPALEIRLWKRIATCVALNIIIKLGETTDTDVTVESEKIRLAKGAVRIVRPGVKLFGLDRFQEVFLIVGTVLNISATKQDVIVAPRRLNMALQEIEIQKGRAPIVDEHGEVIYPEYAALLLVPHGDYDISAINIHDSQANIMIDSSATQQHASIKSQAGRESLSVESGKQHAQPLQRRASNVGGIMSYAKDEERRRSQMAYSTFVQKKHG